MDKIRKQVRRAHWRLNLEIFGRWCLWSLVVCLGIASGAILLRKFFTLGGLDPTVWKSAWLSGGVGLSLIVASVATWLGRHNELDAAVELDRRFGLKERVSSSLMLSGAEMESQFGQALLGDTLRRVERLEVKQEFQLRANRWAWLPLVTAIVAFCVAWLVPDAALVENKNNLGAATVTAKQQVKNSMDELKRKLAERAQQARDQQQPSEADKLLKELERGIDHLSKRENVEKKKALIELNDLAKKLESRRDELGGHQELRQQLSQLANMQSGPADRLANSLQKGDLQSAARELQRMAEALQNGKMSDAEKQQLAEQLDQMQKKIQLMMQERESTKQNLREDIEKRRQAGDTAGAEKLQRQLDQMQKNDRKMGEMSQLASQMAEAAKAMKSGDAQAAQKQMSQLAESLQKMQGEAGELQTLSDALMEIEDAKQSMSCPFCQGAGCSECQNSGSQAGLGSQIGDLTTRPGMGMGQGQGIGDRPESETDTSFYESQVKANPKGGRAVVTGAVAGPNLPGDLHMQIRESMAAATTDESDPLEGLHLPRDQREITREYFHLYREGKN